ncbi:MAG: transglutaminase domain-containing protein [Alistipes sp.]|jgi:transglutaminase-like putative cysteine protease|nr:transglutaminase domain-containing protein [Alistipes sp.]
MKLRLLLCGLAGVAIALAIILWPETTTPYDQNYDPANDKELAEIIAASERCEALQTLLAETPEAEKRDMAFLLKNMPDADREGMDLELLKENVEYANIARAKYSWAKAVPQDVYLHDVLPYHVVDEVRDAWRKDLYEMFSPAVDTCKTMYEALCAVNANIPRLTGVDYNTKREKTNQSPHESMRQGMASCTGLAILLVDAYRAVGIPARFAGTASWHDNRGNHSWTEVWLDGEWRVTEYYFPSKLDHLWFMADASKADANNRTYAIYATRFGKADDWFPMVWADGDVEGRSVEELPRTVGAENVTERYQRLAYEQYTRHIEAGTHTFIKIAGYKQMGKKEHSDDRVAMGVDVFCGTEQMGGGLTAGPLRDMNDMFSVLVEKNRNYELRYYTAEGELKRRSVELGEEPVTVDIYLNE